jgi:hypothetical protein
LVFQKIRGTVTSSTFMPDFQVCRKIWKKDFLLQHSICFSVLEIRIKYFKYFNARFSSNLYIWEKVFFFISIFSAIPKSGVLFFRPFSARFSGISTRNFQKYFCLCFLSTYLFFENLKTFKIVIVKFKNLNFEFNL